MSASVVARGSTADAAPHGKPAVPYAVAVGLHARTPTVNLLSVVLLCLLKQNIGIKALH